MQTDLHNLKPLPYSWVQLWRLTEIRALLETQIRHRNDGRKKRLSMKSSFCLLSPWHKKIDFDRMGIRLAYLLHQRDSMAGGCCHSQHFFSTRYSRIIDSLNVNAILFQQNVTQLVIFVRIPDLEQAHYNRQDITRRHYAQNSRPKTVIRRRTTRLRY